MRVEATRQSSETVYDLFTNEETAKPLLRSHVRAIDDSEDDLLLIYLEAAVDYMQNLSDRLLGVHDVTVYIDKDESKRGPVTFSGVQNVTSVGPLFYNAKDPDDESPFSLGYKMIGEDAIDTDVDYTYGDDDDYGVGREYEVSTTSHGVTFNLVFNVSVIDTTIDNLNVDQVRFIVQRQDSDGTWSNGILNTAGATVQATKIVDANGDSTALSFTNLAAGNYRVEAQAVNNPGPSQTYIGEKQYDYFNVHNGRDFDNQIVTSSYPIWIDIHNGCDHKQVDDNGTDYNRDFWKLHLTAGTPFESLPKQYKQAALLLVGHYYNMREAENIGGITTELKEGVRRLIQSVRQF